MTQTHTIYINTDNIIVKDTSGKTMLLRKQMECSCGWSAETEIIRAEARAHHHLKFSHGGGKIDYLGSLEEI